MKRLIGKSVARIATLFTVFTLCTLVTAVSANNGSSVAQEVERKSYVLTVNDAVLASQLVVAIGGTVSETVLPLGEILVELSDSQAVLLSRSPTVTRVSEWQSSGNPAVQQVAGNWHLRK